MTKLNKKYHVHVEVESEGDMHTMIVKAKPYTLEEADYSSQVLAASISVSIHHKCTDRGFDESAGGIYVAFGPVRGRGAMNAMLDAYKAFSDKVYGPHMIQPDPWGARPK